MRTYATVFIDFCRDAEWSSGFVGKRDGDHGGAGRAEREARQDGGVPELQNIPHDHHSRIGESSVGQPGDQQAPAFRCVHKCVCPIQARFYRVVGRLDPNVLVTRATIPGGAGKQQ